MSSKQEKLERSLDDIIASSPGKVAPRDSNYSQNRRSRGGRGGGRSRNQGFRQGPYKRPFNQQQQFPRPGGFRHPPPFGRNHPGNQPVFIPPVHPLINLINNDFVPDEAAKRGSLEFIEVAEGEDKKLSLSVKLDDEEVMQILPIGQFHFSFLLKSSKFAAEKDELLIKSLVNKILRPFHLFLMKKTAGETQNWYVTDGNHYKAKILPQKPDAMGPPSPVDSVNLAEKRVALLKKLHENCLVLTPTKFNITEATEISSDNSKRFFSPVSAFRAICEKRGWKDIFFWFDKEKRGNTMGFIWTVTIKDVGMTIQPKPQAWNIDRNVAKNLAAENAIKVLKKF